MTRGDSAAGPTSSGRSGRRPTRAVVVGGVVAAAVVLGGVGAVALTGDDEQGRPRASSSAAPSASPAPVQPLGPSAGGPAAGAAAGASATPTRPPTPVEAWRDAVLAEYAPLAQSAFSAVRTINEWNLDRASATDVRARVEVALDLSQQTARSLAARKPLPGTETALAQYRAGADLYLASLRTTLVATRVPDGPLQMQLRRAGARQRDLGDRVFDLAGTSLVPLLPPEPEVEGFRLDKPPEVPDYDAAGLGVGPPLEAKEPVPGPRRTFQAQRPTQPVAAWLADLERLPLPADARLAQLVAGGTAAEAADVANQFVTASDRLYRVPDPEGARNVSTQVQLGLLVAAEAMRNAQAAALVPAAQRPVLRQSAAELLRVATPLRASRP